MFYVVLIVIIALPQIASELQLNAELINWVTMTHLLTAAVFLVPMGKLDDRWGRKRIFLWGNMIFLLSSFGCALSRTATGLIAFRLLGAFTSIQKRCKVQLQSKVQA